MTTTMLDQNRTFSPSDEPRAYRTALGRFATGITVVTALSPDGPIGITANSFASVSLDPALILWSPDKNSSRHDPFVNARAFVVHVLAADQKHICDGFVKAKDAFDGLDLAANRDGVPVIQGCLAVFECTRSATHDAGDHTIVVGQVHAAQQRAGAGLLFANGGFASLDEADGR